MSGAAVMIIQKTDMSVPTVDKLDMEAQRGQYKDEIIQ